jgi:hypothetical protein
VALIIGILIQLLLLENIVRASEQNMSLQTEVRFRDYKVRIYGLREDDNELDRARLEVIKGTTPVYSKRGYEFRIGSLYEDEKKEIANKIGTDITGAGQPDLVISEYTGGAHCCLFLHIFEIGSKFRHVQTISVLHADAADFRNMDDDPALELPINDWTFAYWNTSFAASPAPEVILKYSKGKYRMAPDLMRKPARSPEELTEMASVIRSQPEWKDPGQKLPPKLWDDMLTLIYSGNMDQAWKLFDTAWLDGVRGKQQFLRDFKVQLWKSPFWKEIQELNSKRK